MLNVFTLDNGRLKGGLFQEEIATAEDLALSRPVWVDLESPSLEEKGFLRRGFVPSAGPPHIDRSVKRDRSCPGTCTESII